MIAVVALVAAVASPVQSGEWAGYMQRGASRLQVTIEMPSGETASAFFSAPALGAIEIPLRNVTLRQSVHWELTGDTSTTEFDGTVNGTTITGTFRDPAGNGSFLLQLASLSTEKPYQKQEVNFQNGPVTLAGTVYAPKGTGKHPAMIFVHGSGAEGRWGAAYLADYVARRGIVALIYDKRGVGASTGDWRASTMEDLIGDARAGVALLARRADVDQNNIGVYGHSQGSTIAPAIAQNNPNVAWIIAADGYVGPNYQQDLYRVDRMLSKRYSGTDLAQAERVYAEMVDLARSGASLQPLYSDVQRYKNAPWLADLGIPSEDNWVWAWYRKTGNYNNQSAWATVRVPVLIIFGADDQLVPLQSIAATTAILRENGDRNVLVHVFPKADHTLHVPPASSSGWPSLPDGFPQIIVDFATHASAATSSVPALGAGYAVARGYAELA
ncbi:MAG: alpha/beta hydrolase [Candidatus Cybelea sp.]